MKVFEKKKELSNISLKFEENKISESAFVAFLAAWSPKNSVQVNKRIYILETEGYLSLLINLKNNDKSLFQKT